MQTHHSTHNNAKHGVRFSQVKLCGGFFYLVTTPDTAVLDWAYLEAAHTKASVGNPFLCFKTGLQAAILIQGLALFPMFTVWRVIWKQAGPECWNQSAKKPKNKAIWECHNHPAWWLWGIKIWRTRFGSWDLDPLKLHLMQKNPYSTLLCLLVPKREYQTISK